MSLAAAPQRQGVRPAAVAGMFYPAEPRALQAAVHGHLQRARLVERAEGRAERPPKLIVVPHAGYVYSGDVAASAYARLAPLQGVVRRVVLLGPVHRVPVRGLAAPAAAAFDTPLGRVPVDTEALALLADLPQVGTSERAHAQEHALEVQLPFLQAVLGSGWKLVPLAVGEVPPERVAEVLERLWGGDETLIVISTDLSHYLSHTQAQARDRATVQRVLAFAQDLRGDEACGAMPLNGALRAAHAHGLQAQLLDLRDSSETAGGSGERVVGYGALAFVPAGGSAVSRAPADTQPDPPADGAVDPALGRALLAMARHEIASALGLPAPQLPQHPRLAEPGATFVTLHDAQGALRGCIGQLEPRRMLGEDVRHNARMAAFGDPRFPPLCADEWPRLQLEVSLLGPMQALPSAPTLAAAAAQLRPGVDGVVLAWQGRRGTFLPQVWEQLPDRREFLSALLRKAGLPLDFWADDIHLWRYSVTVFEEPRHERPH